MNRRTFLKSIAVAISVPYIPTMALPDIAIKKVATLNLLQELWPETLFKCTLENMQLVSLYGKI